MAAPTKTELAVVEGVVYSDDNNATLASAAFPTSQDPAPHSCLKQARRLAPPNIPAMWWA